MSKKRELCLACEKWPAEKAGLCMGCQMAVSMIICLGHPSAYYQKAAEAILGAQIVYARVGRAEAQDFLAAQIAELGEGGEA